MLTPSTHVHSLIGLNNLDKECIRLLSAEQILTFKITVTNKSNTLFNNFLVKLKNLTPSYHSH